MPSAESACSSSTYSQRAGRTGKQASLANVHGERGLLADDTRYPLSVLSTTPCRRCMHAVAEAEEEQTI